MSQISSPIIELRTQPVKSALQLASSFVDDVQMAPTLDALFSQCITSLNFSLQSSDVQVYTFAIKNQKIDTQYTKYGKTGRLKKSKIDCLPPKAALVTSACSVNKTVIIQSNKDNAPFVHERSQIHWKMAIPFQYLEKTLGCIYIECPKSKIDINELQQSGMLISRHLQLICHRIIEQHHLDEFKSRIRRLLNAKIAQLEEALNKADKYNQSLKDFAYIVSHDLREPLRTINSYIKLLDRRYQDKFDGDAKDFMFFVTDGVERMDALIKDLLAFSRVENSVYQFSEVSIDDILFMTKNSLRLKIEETATEIIFDTPPEIIGSKSHLNILFQNLIDNAIKFRGAKQAPRIVISSKELPDYWQFSIADNGIGMDLEHKNNERIFKVFQRLQGFDSQYPGTGIGLAICKNIVLSHGGKIWVNSTIGKGSTFYFTISKKMNIS